MTPSEKCFGRRIPRRSGGLPAPSSAYTGALIVAAKPDVLAALAEPGGYLATQFLYQNFVSTMTAQIR
jgi:hypothetical protein